MYGLGFYGAIDMGANVYQDRGDTRVFTGDNRINDITDRDFDATLTVDPKNDVGFFGGIKLGYVFGSGVVRPTIEGDFFYNGFRGGANFTLRDRFDDVIAQRNVTTWINTGAFMANFILRFAPGEGKISAVCGRRGRRLLCRICGGRGCGSRNRSCPSQHWRGSKSCGPGVAGDRGCGLLFQSEASARLLNTSTSNTRAPKSRPAKVAFWGSSSSARVSDSIFHE